MAKATLPPAGAGTPKASKRATAPQKRQPFGRRIRDFEPLLLREIELLEACSQGHPLEVADEPPTSKNSDNEIRGGFIRFLALGGDDRTPVHEKGIYIRGAYISNEFNCDACIIDKPITFRECVFEEQISFQEAHIATLSLSGSIIPGLYGDRLTCRGGIFLRHDFQANGEVRLLGARVSGNLDCSGGKFNNPQGNALIADKARISGSVLLCDNFSAVGKIKLSAIEVGGVLDFTKGSFQSSSQTIVCDFSNITGTFIFRNVTAVNGIISLCGTQVGALIDSRGSWDCELILDGFKYGRIDSGPTDAKTRIDWLKLQFPENYGETFWPQPWEHLAKILREMGHTEDAKLIAMEKQREMRRHGLIGGRIVRSSLKQPLRTFDRLRVSFLNWMSRALHQSYGALAGYGYRPLRTFMLMTSVWLLATATFWVAEARGLFVPSATALLTDTRYDGCGLSAEGRIRWTRCPQLPRDYTTFDPLMYSLDVILPLVDLKQESDWEPVVRRGPEWKMWDGLFVRAIMWIEILFGWVGSLLIVSALGRLVQKD